jgi:D-cysteine desulfhydrase
MKLEELKRRGYVKEATPLQKLENFSKLAGGPEIWIKRDDLLPFGGNKTRKLDYLMQEAVDAGADTVITASTNQCCHNGILLLMANHEGMKTQVIMESWGDPSYTFENAPEKELYKLAGADLVVSDPAFPAGPVDKLPKAVEMAEKVRSKGGKPWFISRGGAGPLGSCGYVRAAYELAQQWGDTPADAVVVPCGLGGTQAGLVVGLHMLGAKTKVYGIGVTGKTKDEMESSVYAQCNDITEFLGIGQVPRENVICVEGYSGDGYAKPFAEEYDVMKRLASSEGILTDPVYSGKTLTGLAGLCGKGVFHKGQKVVFLHTGGMNLYYDFSTLSRF